MQTKQTLDRLMNHRPAELRKLARELVAEDDLQAAHLARYIQDEIGALSPSGGYATTNVRAEVHRSEFPLAGAKTADPTPEDDGE